MSQTLLIYKEEKRNIFKATAPYLAFIKNVRVEVLNFALFLGIVALVAAHLLLANSAAISVYNAGIAQKTIENLQLDIRKLNLELSKIRSISFLRDISVKLNLLPVSSIQYVKRAPDFVALNQ